tara:strand:- start:661 stop:1269 length:609 start_codon:yes stop_codon:yes gene_type:complete
MADKLPNKIFPLGRGFTGYYLVITEKPFRTDCCRSDENNVTVPAGISIITASGIQERRLAQYRRKRKGVPYGATWVKLHKDRGGPTYGKQYSLAKIVAKVAPTQAMEMERRMAVMSNEELQTDQRKFIEAVQEEKKVSIREAKINKDSKRDDAELEERKKFKGTNSEFNKMLQIRRNAEKAADKRTIRNSNARKRRDLNRLL